MDQLLFIVTIKSSSYQAKRLLVRDYVIILLQANSVLIFLNLSF